MQPSHAKVWALPLPAGYDKLPPLRRITSSDFAEAMGFYRQGRLALWEAKSGATECKLVSRKGCMAPNFVVARQDVETDTMSWVPDGIYARVPCKRLRGQESRMRWGIAKEREVIEKYAEFTGNMVKKVPNKIYKRQEYEWLAAKPDGVVSHGDQVETGLLEIKCTVMDASVQDHIPYFYIPQAQGAMEILDKEWLDFFLWKPGGSAVVRIERDREYWEFMLGILEEFWRENVVPARKLLMEGSWKWTGYAPTELHPLSSEVVGKSVSIAANATLIWKEDLNGQLQTP